MTDLSQYALPEPRNTPVTTKVSRPERARIAEAVKVIRAEHPSASVSTFMRTAALAAAEEVLAPKPPERETVRSDRIALTPAEFEALLEYSTSFPTGTTLGKRWKRHHGGAWLMGEYVESTKSGYVDIVWRTIVVEGA